MSKDRAAPFSRKHRRYWLPVTGGMILIGAINVVLGYCAYEPPPPAPQKIELVLPPSPYAPGAGTAADAGADGATPDAGVDGATATPATPAADATAR